MILILFCFYLIIELNANKDFIINNELCKMPNFPAFSHETKAIFTRLPYVNCTSLELLTSTTVENNTGYLHIKEKIIRKKYGPNGKVTCCYSYVKRNGTTTDPDDGISISPCEPFNSTIQLEEDIVMVECFYRGKKIYANVHSIITVPASVQTRLQNLEVQSEIAKKKPLSVLILVIDSIGRLNFERTMPLTKNFLTKNNFTEMLGYNKIDENTFPNFNALLTGLNLEQSMLLCNPEIVGELDKCPMAWYDFRDSGYATAYAEDWPELATFNEGKKGFQNPPTDYYFRAYMEAAASLGTTQIDNMPYCAGPESQGERILNLAKEFAITFKNRPSFGIFWMNTFSHNRINSPTRMDKTFKTFFQSLKTDGILNDSMVMLLSDHGIRYGKILETIQGWYEERLPLNFISLPPWFIEENETKNMNLQRNSKKLTSTYDLHLTLQDVLSSSVQNYTAKRNRTCLDCKSLFSEIPEQRSCDSAGIPEIWCSCLGKFKKNVITLTPKIKKEFVKFLNNSNLMISSDKKIKKISLSSIIYQPHGAYVLVIINTADSDVYQVLAKAHVKPFLFCKIVQFRKIAKQ